MHDGGVFVAMEFVAGGDLARFVGGKPSTREILRVFVEAARGLAAVHARSVVHRDFKPGNVLVTEDGTAKVTDFGLAALREHGWTPSLVSDGEDVERSESVVGTPAYMAPEQFDGLRVGPQADQFSFGVALYEALVGKRPYTGRTIAALSVACRRPEFAFGRAVPRRVQALIRRTLAADPAERYGSMDAVAAELHRALHPPWRKVVYPGLAALGAAAVVGALTRGPAACEQVAAEVQAAWSDEVRVQLRPRIEGAEASRDRLLNGLDEYAATVSEAMHAACVANKVEQSASDRPVRPAHGLPRPAGGGLGVADRGAARFGAGGRRGHRRARGVASDRAVLGR